MNSEKYSRGRRGAPAKGVGRATGARVQIPLSPLVNVWFLLLDNILSKINKSLKKIKKLVDIYRNMWYYIKAAWEAAGK